MSRRKTPPNNNPHPAYFDPELRCITLNPHLHDKPAPAIDIVLSIDSFTASSSSLPALQQFCRDFGFTLIHIPTLLHSLANNTNMKEDERRRALGSLHPISLKQALESRRRVPPFFLLPIVKFRIDEDVNKSGVRKFLLAGLEQIVGDGDVMVDFVQRMQDDIASLAAVISFHEYGCVRSKAQSVLEDHYQDALLRIWKGDDVSKTYQALLGAIFEKAGKPVLEAPSPASSVTLRGSDRSNGSNESLARS